MTLPSRSIRLPPAWCGNSTEPRPTPASEYSRPKPSSDTPASARAGRQTGAAAVEEGEEVVMGSPQAPMTAASNRSMSLIAANGSSTPPTP